MTQHTLGRIESLTSRCIIMNRKNASINNEGALLRAQRQFIGSMPVLYWKVFNANCSASSFLLGNQSLLRALNSYLLGKATFI